MDENSKRVELLYIKHRVWLSKVAFNICRDTTEADDLISDLYIYLLEKNNENLWYSDGTFNLQYCRSFLLTRWINKTKIKKRYVNSEVEVEESIYDIEEDLRIQQCYDEFIEELERLKTTKLWASAKLAELYWFSQDTLEDVSEKIKISKSTTFLNVKKIREHLKEKLENPFNEKREIHYHPKGCNASGSR
jgi:DNA-directed RNA polymerase specialized sigma24 family protein